MAKQTRAPDAAVTGVATGNLGTGTALDDTQVYSVDALATADHPDAAGRFPEAEPVAPARPIAARPVAASPAVEPASVAMRPAPTRPLQRQHRITGGYPVGILAAVGVALVAVAAVLTMRGGGITGGGPNGPGFAGAASFPPPPSFGPITTTAPEATRAPKQHGHGHGQDSH